MKPTRLSHDAALELFRFSVEQLVKALYPTMDPRTAARKANLIQLGVLNVMCDAAEPPPEPLTTGPPPCE